MWPRGWRGRRSQWDLASQIIQLLCNIRARTERCRKCLRRIRRSFLDSRKLSPPRERSYLQSASKKLVHALRHRRPSVTFRSRKSWKVALPKYPDTCLAESRASGSISIHKASGQRRSKTLVRGVVEVCLSVYHGQPCIR